MKEVPIAICIKFGGSILTDKSKPLTPRSEIIRQICEEFAACYRKYPEVTWFLGNGVGSYGHYVVHETDWRNRKSDMHATAKVRQATGTLNQLIIDELIRAGVPAISVPPAAYLIGKRTGESVQSGGNVLAWAKLGAVPVVYGDLVPTDSEEALLVPTERLLLEAAREWAAAGGVVRQTIYCTAVDGVLDENGSVIPILEPEMFGIATEDVAGYDVSGGMKQKVLAGFSALDISDSVSIINGFTSGTLLDSIDGKAVGTRLSRG